MSKLKLNLSEKQNLALELLNNPQITELLFGGAAGGAKSWTVCLWIMQQCRNYPGVRIGLGRKELTRLKQTTVVTMLREVFPMIGMQPHEYTYNDHKGLIEIANGSQIQLFDLARQPSDPEFDTLGSLNLTHVVIEEAGEIVKKAKDVFGSRKNRFLNTEYGLVGKTVLTCNPSQNFVRTEFYDPYVQAGDGDYRMWETGVVEIGGKLKTSYSAFIKSLPIDNPFLSHNYIEVLRKLPAAERKRLLEGNWDYADDDSQLVKGYVFDRAMISDIPPTEKPKKSIGVDVADTGKDRTIVSLVIDNILVEAVELKVDTTIESAVSRQTAMELIKFAQQNGFDNSMARDIGIDVLGVGVGVRDFMRSMGWFCRDFVAGSKATNEGYKNKRSESYWNYAQGLESGKYKIHADLSAKESLRRESTAHEYTTEERVIRVLPKDKVKEKLGFSPDYADSAVIAFDTQNDTAAVRKKVLF